MVGSDGLSRCPRRDITGIIVPLIGGTLLPNSLWRKTVLGDIDGYTHEQGRGCIGNDAMSMQNLREDAEILAFVRAAFGERTASQATPDDDSARGTMDRSSKTRLHTHLTDQRRKTHANKIPPPSTSLRCLEHTRGQAQ